MLSLWLQIFFLLSSVLCRQVITNNNGMPLVVHIEDKADIILRGDEDVDVAIVTMMHL
jgi:hypothetical protein